MSKASYKLATFTRDANNQLHFFKGDNIYD